MMAKHEWAERAAARVEAAHAVLAEQVEALRSGEDWKRFLEFQARLHQYSPGNVMLISAQHAQAFADGLVDSPELRYVAGFNTWKALGRSVDKGQHGYAVLAPMTGQRRVAVDEGGHVRPLDKNDAPKLGETEERRKSITGFRVEHVFELCQTSGASVPEPVLPKLLEGQAPAGLGAAVMGLIEGCGYRVETVADSASIGGANGRTNWDSHTVLVRADMDDAAMVKTLMHEAAHVMLHEGPPGRFLSRPVKEVEAESVAYVVAAAHGMVTDSYSFPYVAAWAGEDPAKTLRASQGRVGTAARMLIEASPAAHVAGGRVPGPGAAVEAARRRAAEATQRQAELASQPATAQTGPAVA